MCRLCKPQCWTACPTHDDATEAGAPASLSASAQSQAAAAASLPRGIGGSQVRTLIKGGVLLSMDCTIGDFAKGDVLLEESKINVVGDDLKADDAAVIGASNRIVLPGFVDTHHHQFETVLRGQLANGSLVNDGRPESRESHYETVLQTLSMLYQPHDVDINELFESVSQLDAGVTTAMDVSQIHYSPEHSDAAIESLHDDRRRSVLGCLEGWGETAAYALNVAPLNRAVGAVVTLMERVNVDAVLVAGKVKKWQAQLLGFNLARLRREIEESRDYLFGKAGNAPDLFAD
jgi:hypothetical protein